MYYLDFDDAETIISDVREVIKQESPCIEDRNSFIRNVKLVFEAHETTVHVNLSFELKDTNESYVTYTVPLSTFNRLSKEEVMFKVGMVVGDFINKNFTEETSKWD